MSAATRAEGSAELDCEKRRCEVDEFSGGVRTMSPVVEHNSAFYERFQIEIRRHHS